MIEKHNGHSSSSSIFDASMTMSGTDDARPPRNKLFHLFGTVLSALLSDHNHAFLASFNTSYALLRAWFKPSKIVLVKSKSEERPPSRYPQS
jgi:hypothetical protein